MKPQIWDYRNGKYQGFLQDGLREGYGVFIDDQLTFYVSDWHQGSLYGQTLVYIDHGKYIYGQWTNNMPHGLTVFRSGEAVLVGNFEQGQPTGKCLLIFQRLNFACILQEINQNKWTIGESGRILNQKSLLEFIKLTEMNLPQQYFSLTRFVDSISNNNQIKSYTCKNKYCYFGFQDGLAIIFNSINALISIGYHKGTQLVQFGGKFQGKQCEEGSFQPRGQTIKYNNNRPDKIIHAIYSRLHKKSLNFINGYFDSKVKVFQSVQNLIRSKINEISTHCYKKQNKIIDLGQSLDYQQLNEQDSIEINAIRENIYGSIKQQIPEKQQNYQIQEYPQHTFKIQNNFQDNSLQEQYNKKITPRLFHEQDIPQYKQKITKNHFQLEKNNRNLIYSNSTYQSKMIKQNTFSKQSKQDQIKNSKGSTKMKSNNLKYINIYEDKQIKSNLSSAKSNSIYKQCKVQTYTPTISLANKDFQSRQSKAKLPTFKKIIQQENQHIKNIVSSQKKQINIRIHQNQKYDKKYKPIYQDIQERKKRILQSYQNKEMLSQKNKNIQSQQHKFDSPYQNFNLILPPSQHDNCNAFLPLSIKKQKQTQNKSQTNKLIELQQKYKYQNNKKSIYQQQKNDNKFHNITLPYKRLDVQKKQKQNQNIALDYNINYKKLGITQFNKIQNQRSPARNRKNYQYLCS